MLYHTFNDQKLEDYTRIKNLEKYVVFDTILEEKCKNLYCSKRLSVDPDFAFSTIKQQRPFILYT